MWEHDGWRGDFEHDCWVIYMFLQSDTNDVELFLVEKYKQCGCEYKDFYHIPLSEDTPLSTNIHSHFKDWQDHQGALHRTIVIVCTVTGASWVVLLGVVWLVFRKWKAKLVEENEKRVDSHAEIKVIPGKLRNNRPAILVDEGDKFGLNEIDDVTAGEGADLVNIARPLETAGGQDSIISVMGAERKLSEELLDIQPICQDQEGRKGSELHGRSTGDEETHINPLVYDV